MEELILATGNDQYDEEGEKGNQSLLTIIWRKAEIDGLMAIESKFFPVTLYKCRESITFIGKL